MRVVVVVGSMTCAIFVKFDFFAVCMTYIFWNQRDLGSPKQVSSGAPGSVTCHQVSIAKGPKPIYFWNQNDLGSAKQVSRG